MKKTFRFGYLFALIAVTALFACNQNEEEDNTVVNDSAFVGTWKLKSVDKSTKAELLDTLGKVTETIDPYMHENETYANATIEFKEDWTALSIIRDGNTIETGAYKWEDLGQQFVLKTYATYQKVQIDTFDISRSGSAVTFKTIRKDDIKLTRNEDFYDEENDTTYQIPRTYDAKTYTTVTINIDK